jgi:hypothetical protein
MNARPMTVAELVTLLQGLPQDAQVFVTGTDVGGYDCIVNSHVLVRSEGNLVLITSLDTDDTTTLWTVERPLADIT